MAAALILLALFLAAHRSLPVVDSYPDSAEYVQLKAYGFPSSAWLAVATGKRPFTVPVLYWLLGSPWRIVLVQELFAFGAWLALAASLARLLPAGWPRFAAAPMVMAYAFSGDVLFWNRVILSESFSISFAVLWMAAAAWVGADGRRPVPERCLAAASLAVVSLPFAFCRDVNAYLLPLAVVPAAAALARRGLRPLFAAVCLSLALIVSLSLANAASNRRHLAPLMNVIGRRILPDAEAARFFRERGLPESPSMKGKYWFQMPDWGRLDGFFTGEAGAVYVRFLLTHPRYVLRPLAADRAEIFDQRVVPWPWEGPPTEDIFSYARAPGKNPVYDLMGRLSAPKGALFLALAAVWAALGAAALAARGRELLREPAFVLLATMTAAALVNILVSYHGDAAEVARHCLVGSIMLKVAMQAGIVLFLARLRRRA